MQIDKKSLFSEIIVKENRGGHGNNKLSIPVAKERYSTSLSVLIDEEWNGYFSEHMYMCCLHNIVFMATPQFVCGRNSTKCEKCIKNKNLTQLEKYTKIAFENDFILLANEWRGTKAKYLFWCIKHEIINLSSFSNALYRKNGISCCYFKEVFSKEKSSNIFDIHSKYELIRQEK